MNILRNLTTSLSCLGLLFSLHCSAAPDGHSAPSPAAMLAKQQASKLLFTENRGQVADNTGKSRTDILFSAHNGATNIYLTSSGIFYQFTKTDYPEGYKTNPKEVTDPGLQEELEQQVVTSTYRFSVSLAGANPHPVVRREHKNECVENFYLPQCPGGITGVATYERLVYENVYPHIDWVVYSNGNRMKYDFVVRPGGDVSRIKLAVNDAQDVTITPEGELLMATTLGEIRENAPVSYAGKKKIVTHFKKNSDGSIGFTTGDIAPGATLVIDPSVSWSTYFGGSGTETTGGCAVDGSGNIIMAGSTTSTSGIAFSGYQMTNGGGTDGYITKFSSSGTLIWATYYGGTATDNLMACTTDASNNVFVSGVTVSSGFAVGGYQTAFGVSGQHAILAKFNSAGIFQWSTYYGGAAPGLVIGASCATDGSNVFMAGYLANNEVGLATPGAFHTAPSDPALGQNGILVAFSSSGSRLWATYYGGGSGMNTHFQGVTCDGTGNVIATGVTNADTSMATTGTYQTVLGGGNDAFLVKFSNTGTRLLGTYYGGTGADQGNGCTTDASGNIYITGVTASPSGIASTTGAVQGTIGGGNDAFIAKFSPTGSRIWGTYYGGTGADQGNACTVDPSGNVIVAGTTASASGIASGGFQSTIGGGNDAMVVKLDDTGGMVWASYMGGTGGETGTGIAYNASAGVVYLCGVTASASGIASATGAYQPSLGGGNDGYLTQIIDVAIITGTVTGSPLCAGAAVSVPFTAIGSFGAGNVFTAQLSDASGSFAAPVVIGTLASVTSGTVSATIPLATAAGTGYRIRVISNTPPVTGTNNGTDLSVILMPSAGTITGTATVCAGATTSLSDATGDAGGTWSSTVMAKGTVSTSGTVTGIAAGTTTISYTVSNSCGTVAATAVVTVNPLPNTGTVTGTMTVCPTAAVSLSDATGDAGGTWSSTAMANGTINTTGVVTGIAAGTTTISYTVTNGCGTLAATAVVTVEPTPNAGSITGTATVCAGSSTPLSDLTGDAGGAWSSATMANGTVNTTGSVAGIAAGTTTISYTVTNSCGTAAATDVVTVNPLPAAGAVAGTFTVCPGSTTSLSDPTGDAGGMWSSSLPAHGTISTTGVVTGIAAGTTIISYTSTNGCGTAVATQTVTVNALPVAGTVTGGAPVCTGGTTSLTDIGGDAGGAWSSFTPATGTVNTSGVVTGIAAGTTTISYTVTNSCGTAAATAVATVSALPDAGTITGTLAICQGSTSVLSDAAGGGTWSSVTMSVATISPAGLVIPFAGGTSVISYTVTNGCGTAVTTAVFTVNPLPVTGSLAGASTVCAGSALTLTDVSGTAGGTWSSTIPGHGTVSTSGVVTGIAAGTTTISYAVTNGCGTLAATKTVTVNALATAGTIFGATTVCQGVLTLFTDGATGGTWSSSAPAIASVTTTGTVGGSSGGTAIISYIVTNSCNTAIATKIITVNPAPAPITMSGGGNYCAGGAGEHAGLTSSEAGISYQLYYGITPIGSPVTGTGAIIDFGVYTTAGTYTVLATNTTTGCTWNMTGSAVISITPVSVSSVTLTNTVIHDSACTGVPVTLTATAVNGGSSPGFSWAVNGSAVSASFNTYTYLPTTGDIVKVKLTSSLACAIPDSSIAYDTLTVLPSETPSVSISASSNPACAGTTVTFHATPVYGGDAPAFLWTENGINVATGPDYLYIPASGDVLYCMLISDYFCRMVDSVHSTDTITMTLVTPVAPVVSIVAHPGLTVAPGQVDTLKATVTGGAGQTYQWQVNGANITGATSSAYFGTFNNNDSVTCIVTNTDACRNETARSVRVHISSGIGSAADNEMQLTLTPNPNDGNFILKGSWPGSADEEVTVEILNLPGQCVYKNKGRIENGKMNEQIQAGNTLAPGVYLLNVYSAGGHKVIRFVKE